MPAAHGAHVGSEEEVPGAVCTVPAWQASCGWQVLWFFAVENLPASHVKHWRSDVGEPAWLTYWPALQSVHGVQLAAFDVMLYEFEQPVQVWSDVVVPGAPMNVPAVHGV